MNESVAIAGAARSPEYWLPVGAQACKEGLVYDEKQLGQRVMGSKPGKVFHPKYLRKICLPSCLPCIT